jgi:hypothetical protein
MATEQFYVNSSHSLKSGASLLRLPALVEFNRAPSMLEFVRMEDDLSKRLGIKVDLVMKKALKPYIGRHILDEVVSVCGSQGRTPLQLMLST